MTIKLKLGEEAYALYKEDTDEYVYLGGGNGIFGFKTYPKPTGMSTSIEKAEKKLENLISRVQVYAEGGEEYPFSNLSYQEIYDKLPSGYKTGMSFDIFVRQRKRNLEAQRKRWTRELEIAKSFIIVKISVEKA